MECSRIQRYGRNSHQGFQRKTLPSGIEEVLQSELQEVSGGRVVRWRELQAWGICGVMSQWLCAGHIRKRMYMEVNPVKTASTSQVTLSRDLTTGRAAKDACKSCASLVGPVKLRLLSSTKCSKSSTPTARNICFLGPILSSKGKQAHQSGLKPRPANLPRPQSNVQRVGQNTSLF